MDRPRRARLPSSGFTLVELVVVLLIVGVLAGLLFSVSDGIIGRGQRGRAQSELEAIQVALESYRARFGDYPDVVGARQFFDALEGKVGPKGNVLTPPYPPFLVAGNFSIGSEESPELIDPWGNPYVYQYIHEEGEGGLSAYLLFSAGPDGTSSPDGRGSEPSDDDNLWADG